VEAVRDDHDRIENRQNLARWGIEHSERLGLDLRGIYFLNDCIEFVLALLPRCGDLDPYSLKVDYLLGRTEAEHAIEEELRFALCELQKQKLKAMGLT
jgi:hypothetical protein